MIVQAGWPGATVEETIKEVTDRIERKLQETPGLDSILSYTTAGRTTVFVNLRDTTRSADVSAVWYQVRKKMDDIRGTLPAGVVGPGFNDEFGDTYGIVYCIHRGRLQHRASCATMSERSRSQLLQRAGRLQDRHLRGAGREDLHRVLLAPAGGTQARPQRAHRRAALAERGDACRGGGEPQTSGSWCRSLAASATRRTCAASTSSSTAGSSG